MARKKVEEKDRCQGTTRKGDRCRFRAAFGGPPPRWCGFCDPSPEAVARRKAIGAKRHAPGTPEAKARDEARVDGTLDDVVRGALKTARDLEERARKAAADKDTLGAARMANAAAALHRATIQALRARGHVGDLPESKRQHSPTPLHPGDPVAPPPAAPGDALAALRDGLDS